MFTGICTYSGPGVSIPPNGQESFPPKQNAGPQRDPGAESLVEIWGQKLNNTRYFSANSERKFNEFTGKTRSFCKDVASSEPNLLYVCKPRNGCDINIFNLGLHKNWVYFWKWTWPETVSRMGRNVENCHCWWAMAKFTTSLWNRC